MTGKLIDANAFKKENERLLHCDFPYLSETTLEELIDEATTIDAEPVRHGKWEPVSDGVKGGHFECCVCKHPAFYAEDGVEELTMFCPNCGARMDEE